MLIRLITLNARFVHSAPALFYLRQVLERNLAGSRVEICQFTINDPYYETLLQILAPGSAPAVPEGWGQGQPQPIQHGPTAAGSAGSESGAPEIVGSTAGDHRTQLAALFFSVYVWNAAYTRRLIIDLHQVRPDLPVVVGGPQAPHLDLPSEIALCVVQGPAEGLGPEFYRDLVAGRLRPVYRARAAAPFTMPYRAGDFAGELQNRQIYYESTRGCPFACAYCLSAGRRGVVYRELTEVLAELKELLAWGPPVIRFIDRTFNAPPERALAIWRFLAEQAGVAAAAGRAEEFPVCHFEIAPDLFDEASLAFLATIPPGIFQFEIGLQSFNLASLAAVNRNPDLERAQANIRRLLVAANIHLHLDLILGLPFETVASYRRALNEVLALRPHHLQLGLLKVLPDTPLAGRCRDFDLRASREPPYPVLATRWLPQPQLAELFELGELIESYYNPRYFLASLAYLLTREPDPAAFFSQLAATFRAGGFSGRARTQELLSQALALHLARRPDGELALELLRFDWLACGHRRLPDHLLTSQWPADQLKKAQDQLWQKLPDNLPPWFNSRSRSAFFKRTVFAPFSPAALAALGLANGDSPGTVAFLATPAPGLKARQATALFHATGHHGPTTVPRPKTLPG